MTDLFEQNIKLQRKEIEEGVTCISSIPTRWAIPVATKCNLKCFMCGIGVNLGYYEINLPDTFYDELSAFLPYIKRMSLNGAEPFNYKKGDQIDKFFSLAKKYPDLKFSCPTNATLLNKEKARLCLETFCDVNISMDSPRADIYESIRRGAKFEKTIQNIEYLRDLKTGVGRSRDDYPHIGLNCIVMNRTYKDLLNFFELAKDLGAKMVVVSPLRMQLRGNKVAILKEESIFNDKKKVRHLAALLSEVKQRAAKDNIVIIDRCTFRINSFLKKEGFVRKVTGKAFAPFSKKGANKTKAACAWGWDGFFVWPDGAVSFCCASKKIGNLHEMSISEIINSKEAQRERANFLKGNYSNCNGDTCLKGLHNFV